jgi:hypothetical protein
MWSKNIISSLAFIALYFFYLHNGHSSDLLGYIWGAWFIGHIKDLYDFQDETKKV